MEPRPIPPRPKWRADIEGLRGIAVLLVVLYHLRVPGFSGGYVGVDVFFVLSGYLITGLLVAEGERTGRIDLARFFSRRIRRLLPAAALVLVATCAAVFYFYAPYEHVDILKSARATALYFSNIHFAGLALDYHAATNAPNPLLHTWSLAVEEQFYLAWPLLVLLALLGWREGPQVPKRRRLIGTVWVVVVSTFVLSVALMMGDREHWAFFATQARAWEFGVGALAALLAVPDGRWLAGLRFRGRPLDPSAWTVGLGWTGLAVVLAAGMLYTSRTPFPGVTALLPVLGTALLLRAGARSEESTLARMLSLAPLQVMGRLSYSWYLWHWPVIVIVESVWGAQPLPVRLVLGAAALGLSEATYRLVEHPVRHARWLAGRPAWGLALLLAVTGGSFAATVLWRTVLTPKLSDATLSRFTEAEADYEAHDLADRGCAVHPLSGSYPECVSGAPNADTTLFLFGDSHAGDLHAAVATLAESRGWTAIVSIKNGCPPWESAPRPGSSGRNAERCSAWRSQVAQRITEIEPDLVIIKGSHHYDVKPDQWVQAVDSTYSALSGYGWPVVDIRDFPHARQSPLSCLARRAWRRTDADCSIPRVDRKDTWDIREEAAQGHEDIVLLDLTALTCTGDRCAVETEDAIVYRDPHHLTRTFVNTLAAPLGDSLGAILQNHPSGFRKPVRPVSAETE